MRKLFSLAAALGIATGSIFAVGCEREPLDDERIEEPFDNNEGIGDGEIDVDVDE